MYRRFQVGAFVVIAALAASCSTAADPGAAQVDEACREETDLMVTLVALIADQVADGRTRITSEEELTAGILEVLIALPDADLNAQRACQTGERASASLLTALRKAGENLPEATADLTLGVFLAGCGDIPLAPGDDPAPRQVFLDTVCPELEGYFMQRNLAP